MTQKKDDIVEYYEYFDIYDEEYEYCYEYEDESDDFNGDQKSNYKYGLLTQNMQNEDDKNVQSNNDVIISES